MITKLEVAALAFVLRRSLLVSKQGSPEDTTEAIGKCEGCGGDVVVKTTHIFQQTAPTELIIMGPGGRSQNKLVTEKRCYCEQCGQLYDEATTRSQQ